MHCCSSYHHTKSAVSVQTIKAALGPLPFFRDEEDGEKSKDDKGKEVATASPTAPAHQAAHTRPAVLADGSYASQTAITDSVPTSTLTATAPNIRCRSSLPATWACRDKGMQAAGRGAWHRAFLWSLC